MILPYEHVLVISLQTAWLVIAFLPGHLALGLLSSTFPDVFGA
jgi:hypothetical protein